MKTMKGPAIFLAQFASDEAPFNSLAAISQWASSLGYEGIQIPSWDARFIDLKRAAESKDYCDELIGVMAENNIQPTELSSHLQGQLVAVNPAYDKVFDGFADPSVHNNPAARTEWAIEQVKLCARASRNMGLDTQVGFTGAFAWPFVYPWPQRPGGLIEDAFAELAKRWGPIFDVCADTGTRIGFELHPGEDVFDGTTFERFLEACGNHEACGINYDPSHFVLQALDYLDFIDIYHERIYAFHVKDAELNTNGRQGVYSGFASWVDRAGRFRSLGDGHVDFRGVFSKMAQYDYDGWPVLEWECCLKHPEEGAAEGAPFIRDHIIKVTEKAFDDFAGGGSDRAANLATLGISNGG